MPNRPADLFEDVRHAVGCLYISDLRTDLYRPLAIQVMHDLDLTHYSTATLADMAVYLFGEQPCFSSPTEASIYFLQMNG